MKLKKADTLLIHNAKHLISPNMGNKIYKQLTEFKKKKIIKNIGVSLYTINDLKKIIAKYDIDVVLMSLNIFDQRIIETKIINMLKRKNIKLYTRSTFLQGLLLIPEGKLPTKFYRWNKQFNKFYSQIKKNKISAYDLCLRFVLENPNVDKTLIGIDNFKQFKDILKKRKKINLKLDSLNCNNLRNLINPAKW
jgi:aryl-alcohol dehydrogenase-like predicted oxidoreductase